MIEYIKGDIRDTDCKVIAHGVNCQGVMGSGVAKALYEKWPEVKKSYLKYCNKCHSKTYTKRCGNCNHAHYCNPTCQRADWSTHKMVCETISDEFAKTTSYIYNNLV